MNLRITTSAWTAVLSGVFLFSASTTTFAIGLGDFVDKVKHAGGAVSDYSKKTGGKIADSTKQAGGKASDYAKQVGGKASDYTKQAGPKISNYAEDKVGRHLPHVVHPKQVEYEPKPKNQQSGESPNSKHEDTVTNPPIDINRSQGLTRQRPFGGTHRTGSFTRPESKNGSHSQLRHESRRTSSNQDHTRLYHRTRPTNANGLIDRQHINGKRSGRGSDLKHFSNRLELHPGLAILEKGNLDNIVVSSGMSTLPMIPQSVYERPVPYSSVSAQLAGDPTPQYGASLPVPALLPPVPQPIELPADEAEPLVVDNVSSQIVPCQFRHPSGQVSTLSLNLGKLKLST